MGNLACMQSSHLLPNLPFIVEHSCTHPGPSISESISAVSLVLSGCLTALMTASVLLICRTYFFFLQCQSLNGLSLSGDHRQTQTVSLDHRHSWRQTHAESGHFGQLGFVIASLLVYLILLPFHRLSICFLCFSLQVCQHSYTPLTGGHHYYLLMANCWLLDSLVVLLGPPTLSISAFLNVAFILSVVHIYRSMCVRVFWLGMSVCPRAIKVCAIKTIVSQPLSETVLTFAPLTRTDMLNVQLFWAGPGFANT